MLHVYYMYIICMLYLYIICILCVYVLHFICILYVCYMYDICILYAYYMLIICISYVYDMYIVFILYVYYVYIICILYVYPLVFRRLRQKTHFLDETQSQKLRSTKTKKHCRNNASHMGPPCVYGSPIYLRAPPRNIPMYMGVPYTCGIGVGPRSIVGIMLLIGGPAGIWDRGIGKQIPRRAGQGYGIGL